MASIAMVGDLPSQALAQRGGVDAVFERLAAVHQEDRHLVAVRRRERRVPVDVDLVHLERQLAADRGDDRPHVVAEVAAVPAVEGDPDHRLWRRRLTPEGPSSTDDGSARQDLRAALPL